MATEKEYSRYKKLLIKLHKLVEDEATSEQKEKVHEMLNPLFDKLTMDQKEECWALSRKLFQEISKREEAKTTQEEN